MLNLAISKIFKRLYNRELLFKRFFSTFAQLSRVIKRNNKHAFKQKSHYHNSYIQHAGIFAEMSFFLDCKKRT
jgi:hypothetical protein